jgi:hypothetical protein
VATPADSVERNPRFFTRVWRVSAYQTGPTPGFTGAHPEFFNPLPNLLEIALLRIAFKIEKHLHKDPNTCELTVTNGNDSTRAMLCRTPLVVRVDAGHLEDAGARHLFTGTLRNGYSKQEGTNWHTVLQLGDGASMFDGARANKTFGRGTPAIQVLRYCAGTMGLELPAEAEANPLLQRQYATGISLSRLSQLEFSTLLSPFGYAWSVQDGRLTVLRDEQAAPGTALVISKDTGLIGSPQYATPSKGDVKKGKPAKLTFRTILYPQVTPGFLVSVQSRAINGIFRAERVTHTGDSHSPSDWVTECECTPVQATT